MNDLTILVNTSDNFEDCWDPFFTLFEKFWPNCNYPIILNTENKDYKFGNINIICAKVNVNKGRKLTWSECLRDCLSKINTKYILYLQEDYFLDSEVNFTAFESLMHCMRSGDADVIRIMECEGSGPWQPTKNPLLWEVNQKAKYRISLQASIWKKTVLNSYIRKHESPWQLEFFGSKRASKIQDKILCVNRDIFSIKENEIFPYTPTGVISGKWSKDIVVPLFKKHGIVIDFRKRGFYDLEEQYKIIKAKKFNNLIKKIFDRIRSL